MSKFCPLMTFYNGRKYLGVECLGKKCALAANEKGDCLIRRFLELQVSKPIKEKENPEFLPPRQESSTDYWFNKKPIDY
jgi:hypothetical protein